MDDDLHHVGRRTGSLRLLRVVHIAWAGAGACHRAFHIGQPHGGVRRERRSPSQFAMLCKYHSHDECAHHHGLLPRQVHPNNLAVRAPSGQQKKHHITEFSAVDNILDLKYIQDLFSELELAKFDYRCIPKLVADRGSVLALDASNSRHLQRVNQAAGGRRFLASLKSPAHRLLGACRLRGRSNRNAARR